MNDYKAQIQAILTNLENTVMQEVLLRQSRAKGGRNPKSIHYEATASLLQLLTEANKEAKPATQQNGAQHHLSTSVSGLTSTIMICYCSIGHNHEATALSGKPYSEFKKERLADPEVKAEYDKLPALSDHQDNELSIVESLNLFLAAHGHLRCEKGCPSIDNDADRIEQLISHRIVEELEALLPQGVSFLNKRIIQRRIKELGELSE